MKRWGLLLLAGACAAGYCLSAARHLGDEPGWRRRLARDAVAELPQAPVASWTVKDNEIAVTVFNPLDRPLMYRGRSADDPKVFIEERRHGRWRDTFWDWCGTGVSLYPLAPKGSVGFKVWVPPDAVAVRVYTLMSTISGKNRSLVLLYDSEIPQGTPES